jgi:hypothetical protein
LEPFGDRWQMSVYSFPLNRHLVVFRPEDKQLFILNPTARWIWKHRAAGAAPDDIALSMTDRFSLSLDAAKADLQRTLTQWSASGLKPGQSQPISKSDPPCRSNGVAYTPVSRSHDGGATFERRIRFGQSYIVVRDYTGALSDLLDPLILSLPSADLQHQQGHVDIFRDDDMFVVSHNALETGRDKMDIAAVGLVVQAMLELAYPHTPMAAYIHGAAGALNGQGVLLPGMGGSGKSTLIASLAHAGWTYLCDDTVPMDTSGHMLPLPLNICLKAGSWAPLASLYPGLDELPQYQRIGQAVRYLPMTGTAVQAQKIHRIVFPQYDPEHLPQVQALPPELVLQRMVQAHTWIAPHPGNANALFACLESVPAYEMRYATSAQAIETLAGLLRS